MNSCIILFLLLISGRCGCGMSNWSNWNMCGNNCSRERECDCDCNNNLRSGERNCDCNNNTWNRERDCDCNNNSRSRERSCDEDASSCFPSFGRNSNCGCDND